MTSGRNSTIINHNPILISVCNTTDTVLLNLLSDWIAEKMRSNSGTLLKNTDWPLSFITTVVPSPVLLTRGWGSAVIIPLTRVPPRSVRWDCAYLKIVYWTLSSAWQREWTVRYVLYGSLHVKGYAYHALSDGTVRRLLTWPIGMKDISAEAGPGNTETESNLADQDGGEPYLEASYAFVSPPSQPPWVEIGQIFRNFYAKYVTHHPVFSWHASWGRWKIASGKKRPGPRHPSKSWAVSAIKEMSKICQILSKTR